MKKIKKYLSLILWFLPSAALAEGASGGPDFGLGYAENANLQLGTRDVRETVFAVINVILGFLGIIAVVIILYGGFIWMTAGGNEEKTTEARKLIVAGIIGLAIILASFAIAQFVVTQLYNATK